MVEKLGVKKGNRGRGSRIYKDQKVNYRDIANLFAENRKNHGRSDKKHLPILPGIWSRNPEFKVIEIWARRKSSFVCSRKADSFGQHIF